MSMNFVSISVHYTIVVILLPIYVSVHSMEIYGKIGGGGALTYTGNTGMYHIDKPLLSWPVAANSCSYDTQLARFAMI